LYFNRTYVSIDDDPKVELPDPYEINTTTWDDGEHVVELEAKDTAGNINLSWFNFTIDSEPPKVTLTSPDNNSVLSADTEINLSISDDNLEKVRYSRNGGSKTSLYSPFAINTTEWPDGEYTVTIYAEDRAGNLIENWFLFTKDITLPQITLKSPENNSLLLDPTILDFEVIDDYLDLVRYSVNKAAYKILDSPYDIDTTDWEDGDFNVSIRAEDTAGNMNEQWYLFSFDTTPPSISSTFPVKDAEEVPVDAVIKITFSEPMDQKSVKSAISMEPYTEYTLLWSDENTTLTVNCTEELESNTLYMFTISTQAEDMAGRPLDSRFEFGFRTQEKKEEDGGFPIMYLLLAVILAIVVVLIIVAMIAAKKRKAPKATMMAAQPEIEGPSMMQVTCSTCGNLLQVEHIGVTMNVSCPYCTTLLTVESQMPQQPEPISMPQLEQPTVPITCPRCSFGFTVENTGGLVRIQCPNCGVTGSVDLGGAGLGAAPPPLSKAPAKPSQQIRCPSCENLFVVETTARPISIQCPHCGVTGTLT
ncbi:MAG: Ig-like domain-containing protein, partial [Thermoplasmata archaeon]